MKKLLLILGILIGIMAIAFVAVDEPLPQGEQSAEVNRLTEKMLAAVNYAAWDSTAAVKWSFPGGHQYLWDKNRKLVQVKWDDMRVLLNTVDRSGKAYENGRLLSPEQTSDALETAWKYFANDSFWLAAPFKIYDPGTKRSIVGTEQGDALLVTYTTGGVTPGDTYLWFLSKDGTPIAWKLWVKILPIDGLKFTWEGWQTYNTGARLASIHRGIMDVKVSGIQLGMDVAALNNGVDPFDQL